MTDISFYHLEVSGFEVALPKLLEKVYSSGFKTLVRFGNPELMETLSKALWTYTENSFLPHGIKEDEHVESQPIYLTCEMKNSNSAKLLTLINDASTEGLDAYDRVLIMFDGHSEEMLKDARANWKKFNAEGHKLTYFQQNEQGAWGKKMET